jgi:nitroreductase
VTAFDELLARRRMHRDFTGEPIDPDTMRAILRAGLRAPSAGNTQGIELVALTRPDTIAAALGAVTTPGWLASSPSHKGLLGAGLVIVPVFRRELYLARYRLPDKARSGMGDPARWPQPFWLVDCAFATMTILLKVADLGLGACFLGIYHHPEALRALLSLPDDAEPLGLVAVGHIASRVITGSAARIPSRPETDRVHLERW